MRLEADETDIVLLDIERLGARGDGVAQTARGPLFVAGALPGERVSAAIGAGDRARLVAIEQASAERIAPFCPHFGRCGGCSVQHLAPAPYADWKRGIVVAALAAARIPEADALVAPLVDARGAGRRRMTLHARARQGGVAGGVAGGGVAVGFMAARSHALVPIETCPAAEPGLDGAAPAAHALAALLAASGKPLDIQASASEAGLDIDIRGHGPVSGKQRTLLIAAAERLDLARLSWHGEVLVERRPPLVRMGRAAVVPPPGSFLQATGAGEAALAALVEAALEPARKGKRVADLFAGSGPFALRLAERIAVHAVESEAGALAALEKAARATPGLRPITTERRDLFRRPLLAPELAGFDAVVLDPPRAGAEAQVRRLAETPVAAIAYVSCDPATFARDAAILVAGGYTLARVTPVDQFAYTGHVELVGALVGPKRSRSRR